MDWGDGRHRFALPIGRLRELQDKTAVGPYALYRRLLSGDWRVEDLVETLRLGLIGGGLKPPEALTLTRRYVEDRPLLESVTPALSVLAWALLPDAGAGDEEEDGEKGGKKKPNRGRSPSNSGPSIGTL
ncbi:gene transfer agent family protein [Neomegalonema perideroedes]|uniref:gene transfer agent family protein n=1 Tax=Neomegalonema perideroedes TaxID=217219 RepID=UPI000371F98D